MAEIKENSIITILSAHSHELSLEFFLCCSQKVSVLTKLLFDSLPSFFPKFKALLHFTVSFCDVFFRKVHKLGEWIEMELFKLSQKLFILKLERNHKLRSNLFIFKVFNLLKCERATVQNPTVDFAVRLYESFLNQFDNVAIW